MVRKAYAVCSFRVSERALREIYLPAFKKALQEGETWTIMGAYNRFRGQASIENRYLGEGMVLLKNENDVLPLQPEAIDHLVVIGRNATATHHGGGGSSAVPALYEITPLEGIQKRFGETTKIDYFPGYTLDKVRPIDAIIPSDVLEGEQWQIEFFDNMALMGDPKATLAAPMIDFAWGEQSPAPGMPADRFSVRAKATLRVPETGQYTFQSGSDDGSKLYLNGDLLIDNWRMQGFCLL